MVKVHPHNLLILPCFLISVMWWLGVYLNRFGGAVDQFGALLCRFALAPGMFILLASIVLAFAMSHASPSVRRITFWGSFVTMVDIVVRGCLMYPYPTWFAVLLFAACTTILVIRYMRHRLRRDCRRKRGLCLSCGYSLKGNESGTCPECGTDVKQQ